MERMRYTAVIKPHDTSDMLGSEVIAKGIFLNFRISLKPLLHSGTA